MHTSVPRSLAAALFVLFVASACASGTGATWTYAPVSATLEPLPAESAAPPAASVVPPAASVVPPAESAAPPAESVAPPSGEGRVIELLATAALQFTTPDGTQVKDIPVTPGETIILRIDNTAGFEHNFYIGTDAELSVPGGTTPTGLPNWASGVQELTWVVPQDITGLKYGCTIAGHYPAGMQGTFSVAAPGTAPAASAKPAEVPAESATAAPPADAAAPPAEPAAPADSAAPAAGEGRVIELVANAALQFTTPDGTQVKDIAVTPGETVVFRIDNTAGYAHNFHIGTDAELSVPGGTTPTGIPDWSSGVQELTWVVPADISGLKYGCTVAGHYQAGMQGTFSTAAPGEAPAAPAEPAAGSPAAEAPAESTPAVAHGSMAPMAPAESVATAAPAPPAESAPAPAGEGRVVELAANAALQFTTPDGTQVVDIAVTPGETVVFRIDNTAGYDHNFYIGTDAELSVPDATTAVGIPTWASGVQELTWIVPEDVSGLKYGGTVIGHYTFMQGTFSVAS